MEVHRGGAGLLVNWWRTITVTFPPAVRSAFGTLRRAPLRCAILLQGVLWAAVLGILPPAVIRGSREASISRAREIGSDRILLHDGEQNGSGWRWDIAAKIRSLGWREIRSVTGFARKPPLLETDAATAEACGRKLVTGRWFSPEEIQSGSAVCLISKRVTQELFSDDQAIGKPLPLGEIGRTLQIIGVFEGGEPVRLDGFGFKKDHPLYNMIETAKFYLGVQPADFDWIGDDQLVVTPPPSQSGGKLDVIEVRADPTELVAVTRSLRQELIGAGLQPLLIANPTVQILFSGPMETIDKLLRIIFMVCLGAGTIMVTNLLILTVLERRREIAVRRVEGATTLSIAVQFVIENGVLCFTGALLGIPVALGLAAMRAAIDPSGAIQWIFPVTETAQTVCTVTFFGLAGGLLPALKAARIQPVEVLAHE